MILLAGIVPPPEALRDALAVLRAALPAARPTTRPATRPPGRAAGRGPDAVTTRVLDECEMFVRLARFGSVTPNDKGRLVDALAGAAAEWDEPGLRVGGAAMRPTDGGVVVAAQLEGDVEALTSISKTLNRVAHGAGFLLDRRTFRAEFPVATISDSDPLSAERVARVLGARSAPDWHADEVAVLREAADNTPPRYRAVDRLPLAGGPRD